MFISKKQKKASALAAEKEQRLNGPVWTPQDMRIDYSEFDTKRQKGLGEAHTTQAKSTERVTRLKSTGYVRTVERVERDVKVVAEYTVQPVAPFREEGVCNGLYVTTRIKYIK